MTIQLLHQYNGYRPGVYSTMGSTEEARLVGLGLARYWADGIDGKNTVFSEPEKAAGQALVSEAGNITAAELPATTGTLGQTVRLSDGPDQGAILMWSTPQGASSPTWCWWLWPQAAY